MIHYHHISEITLLSIVHTQGYIQPSFNCLIDELVVIWARYRCSDLCLESNERNSLYCFKCLLGTAAYFSHMKSLTFLCLSGLVTALFLCWVYSSEPRVWPKGFALCWKLALAHSRSQTAKRNLLQFDWASIAECWEFSFFLVRYCYYFLSWSDRPWWDFYLLRNEKVSSSLQAVTTSHPNLFLSSKSLEEVAEPPNLTCHQSLA